MIWLLRSNRRCVWGILGCVVFVLIVVVLWHDRSHAGGVRAVRGGGGPGLVVDETPGDKVSVRASAPTDGFEQKVAEGLEAMPVPEKAGAWERWRYGEGPRRIEDAEVVWQQGADRYIGLLRKESTAQSSYRIYDWSEMPLVINNLWDTGPTGRNFVRALARTRRFAKVLAEVEKAKAVGKSALIVETLSQTVRRFMEERQQVEGTILRLADQEPGLFRPEATERERDRWQALTAGFALSSPACAEPEKVIPMSLWGTQHGLGANAFLLGLTEDTQAMGPLVEIAAYDGEAFFERMRQAFGSEQFRPEDRTLRLPTVVDALDRILVAASRDGTAVPAARAVAEDYVGWREGQNFADREVVEVYPYDAARTPYQLPGMITGRITDVDLMRIELPLVHLTPAASGTIVDYARRCHELNGSN